MGRLRTFLLLIVAFVLGTSFGYGLTLFAQSAKEGEGKLTFSQMTDVLVSALNVIKKYYVVEVKPTKLLENAAKGMVRLSLDAHSDLLTPEETKRLMESTEGSYEGVGMTIGERNGFVVVISPFEGTPAWRAGLKPGDRIIRINDTSVLGWKVDKVSKHLRGPRGTKVKVTVYRPAINDTLTFVITRDKIVLKAVPYYGLFDDGVGYVKLNAFQEDAADKVHDALIALKKRGAKKVVLDLRGNPGGLLRQAFLIGGLFLGEGKLVVYTEGRVPDSKERFYSEGDMVFPEDVPVVVLIDGGSASASEIVAGALQDWDRALIIGDTSFGKGTVQRIFTLPYDYTLRLTIARYHTPSGRSIHKGKLGDIEKDTNTYFTKILKRPIKGGGGIAPDIYVKPHVLPRLVQKAEAKGVISNWATKYTSTHRKPKHPDDITLTDKDLEDFKRALHKADIEFSDCRFDEAKEDFKRLLLSEIAYQYFGEKGRYRIFLRYDPVFKRAVDVLRRTKKTEELFQIKR